MKLALLGTMVALMVGGLKYGRPYLMQAAGMPEGAQISSDESDLMSTVLQSALRLFSGSASRDELASELSDKLYSGRAGAGDMSELGIELVKPGADSSAPGGGAGVAKARPDASVPNAPAGAKSPNAPPGASGPNAQAGSGLPAKQRARAGESPADRLASNGRGTLLNQFWARSKGYALELALVPVVLLGMVVVHRMRRRGRDEGFVVPDLTIMIPADSETFDVKHAVHSLKAEDFELLVALIYQRQGYRVSMPAGLSGGRGGDFMLARKSERVLVQCKKLSLDHKVPVERVRELHEAATAAGATRGMYVASCGFTWDARNFAKAKGVTLINARTLDELITAAREKPDEDLLKVSQWVPKFFSKVQLTTPHCPTCEATMDQINVNDSSVWVCSQRPECRGRRSARKHHKPVPAAAGEPREEKVGDSPAPDPSPNARSAAATTRKR